MGDVDSFVIFGLCANAVRSSAGHRNSNGPYLGVETRTFIFNQGRLPNIHMAASGDLVSAVIVKDRCFTFRYKSDV